MLYSDNINLLDPDDGYFFYIPSDEEINDFFKFYAYLNKIDNDHLTLAEDKLKQLYDRFLNKDSFHSLLFEAYLLQTQNEDLRESLLRIISKNNYDDEFSKALIRKYQSTVKIRECDGKSILQYNYNDEYYDENINLFHINQVKAFNKKLGIMLLQNDWNNLKFKDSERNVKKDSFVLLFGGGTNSMTITFREKVNMDFENFYQDEISKAINFGKFDNWKILELPGEGVFARAGADKIYLGYGTGPDVIPEIDTAAFTIYLYNDEYKTGYSVKYFMNFSKINNNYKIRSRIWNQLLLYLNFAFLEIENFK